MSSTTRVVPKFALAVALASSITISLAPLPAAASDQRASYSTALQTPLLDAGASPVTDDPSVSVVLGEEARDENEPAGLPDESTWTEGERMVVSPRRQKGVAAADPCTYNSQWKLNNLKNPLDVDWADSYKNDLDVTASYELVAERSTTSTYKASATVSTSAQAMLFGKLEVEINAGIEKSKSTRYGSKVTTPVKPHKMIFGDRGMYMEAAGFTNTITYTNCNQKVVTGKLFAPYREGWHLFY